MSKKSVFTTVLVSIVASVLMAACGADSRCPNSGSWMAAGANNPNGLCVTAWNKDGSPASFYAASPSSSQQAQAQSDQIVEKASTDVKEVGKCYNRIGMVTTCIAGQNDK